MAKKAKKRKQLLIIPAGVNFGVGKTFPPIKNKNTHLNEGVPMVMVGKKGKGTSKSVNTDKKALVITFYKSKASISYRQYKRLLQKTYRIR